MYAMVDRDDDIRIGVKSTAILFGDADRFIIAGVQVTVLLVLLMVGEKAGLGLYYHLGLGVAAGLAVYQQYLIRDRDPSRCFRAFINNQWFGVAVFGGILLNYWVEG